ncbi:MAG TPA: TolC family protein [Vicinamibacterales bacterium]|nr:TolC family protein [Vicinamibacterales bacterium]
MTRTCGISLLAVLACAATAGAQNAPVVPPAAPVTLTHPDAATGPPLVVTLSDALQRARQNEPQFLAAAADAAFAHEDRVQAGAARLPSFSDSTQYIGNQSSPGLRTGRFVSMDGVNMYREWLQAHQELSPNTLMGTSARRAAAEEAVAKAKLEIAQRGLVVTVTRAYYSLVSGQRKYASAQQAVEQAQRFFNFAQQQERLGQVARSDVVKAELTYRQQQQAFNEAMLAMDNARLVLAVLLFPTFNENFSVVDDMQSAPPLPPFADVRAMAEKDNPDLRAADQLLAAANADVRFSRGAFFGNIVVDAVYGIEANEFALHSVPSADPELGVLPNLGYAVTVNLTVPLWDWGALRSKLRQSQIRQRQAQLTLSQTQRQLVSNLYSLYNEALIARDAVGNLRRAVELAAESLRLIGLRYQAGESTALEVVDGVNTSVQTRNAADDAEARYRVAIAQLQTLTGSF